MQTAIIHSKIEYIVYRFDECDIRRILTEYINNQKYTAPPDGGTWELKSWHEADGKGERELIVELTYTIETPDKEEKK